MDEVTARRPIKTRGSVWAKAAASGLLKLGVTPNAVSVMSLVFAILAGACLYFTTRQPDFMAWLWLAAAVFIQLRLICNLLDGMLAVEGGLGTKDGDLYNETPDRLADLCILVTAGYACSHSAGSMLGWIAGSSAALTAYVRMHGATLTGKHDFCGPMAKPHRMAAMTLLCLIMSGGVLLGSNAAVLGEIHFWMLLVIAAGTFFTFLRRLVRLSTSLKQAP